MIATPQPTLVHEQPVLGNPRTIREHSQSDILPEYHGLSTRSVISQLRVTGHFAPIGSEDLFANRRSASAGHQFCKRIFPVVKATGRTITQAEIDDALDDTLVAELQLLLVDCSRAGWDGYGAAAVSAESERAAVHFISLLPVNFPQPELSADPDGHVTFEWRRSPRQTLLVSVRPDLVVDYAALIGTIRAHGSEPFADGLPEIVKILARRVAKS